MIIGCIYRHPTSTLSVADFTKIHLQPILEKINLENKQVALMGDFNVDLLKSESENGSIAFYNELSSHFLTPFILQPTRLRSKTVIDNICFNTLEYLSKSGNLLIEISDHLIQFLILEGYVKERSIPDTQLFKRDFSHFNEREFKEVVIDGIDWDSACELHKNDPNLACKKFIETWTFHLDEFAPWKKVSKKEYKLSFKPWMSKEILSKCHKRDKLLKKFKNEKDDLKRASIFADYKKLRNEISRSKRQSKRDYFVSYFEKNKHKSSNVWKGIRSLINMKSSKSTYYKLMDENESIITNPGKIASIFNDHFSTVGRKVDQKIPIATGSYKDYFSKKDKDGKLFINPDNGFFITPSVPAEIVTLIDNLDTNKSSGPNGIPVQLLKTFKLFFAHWLSRLINMSFEFGIFPDILKIAKVTPLHKKNSPLNHLNYRPISLLSVISKLYEKVIYSRIYDYLVENNLIYDKQFGFRSTYSTNHALISITEKIKSLLDKGLYVCGVFIDLEKAFDTVNHVILCDKLNLYGLRGNVNKLIKSYLSNRKQFVSINGSDSELKDLSCGVPQGSSLGPLLFLIYINDFRLCLSQTESGHFADDTFVLCSGKKLKSIETTINTELKHVVKWLRLNRLSLNSDKTELIFFHSKRRNFNYHDISIKFDNTKLIPVDCVKYLGMYIDKYLSWDSHINQLCSKLSRANGIISKLRHNAPIHTCLQVYYAIFYSYLIYGCNIWGLTTEENLNKIIILQKKCLRIMTFSDYNSHTNQLFRDLGIINVKDIVKIQ